MASLSPGTGPFARRINRAHSPILAFGVPWLTVLIGSLAPWLPVIAPAPVVPPLGFTVLLAWRLLRPGLFPLWAGVPLGMFDDLYSGQPFGSGIFLFSLTLLAIELIELRFPWRGFLLDWALATLILAIYLVAAALVSGAHFVPVQLTVIVPQLLLSVVLYPIVARLVALLDRMRLTRVRRLD
jgi:rod shape-determining protein MreD